MRIIRKIPRGLGRYEPLRHADHPRPTTRRQFLAQGFITGGASVLLPSVFSLMANPRIAQAQPPPAGDSQAAVAACGMSFVDIVPDLPKIYMMLATAFGNHEPLVLFSNYDSSTSFLRQPMVPLWLPPPLIRPEA